jgi:hypothetical protein
MGKMAYAPVGMPAFTARIWSWLCRDQVRREAERLTRAAAEARQHEHLE